MFLDTIVSSQSCVRIELVRDLRVDVVGLLVQLDFVEEHQGVEDNHLSNIEPA